MTAKTRIACVAVVPYKGKRALQCTGVHAVLVHCSDDRVVGSGNPIRRDRPDACSGRGWYAGGDPSLRWRSGLDCGDLSVPIDYANPNGPHTTIGVARLKANDPAHGRNVAALWDRVVGEADAKPLPAKECVNAPAPALCRATVTGDALRFDAQEMLFFKEPIPALGMAGWNGLAQALAAAGDPAVSPFSSRRARTKMPSSPARLSPASMFRRRRRPGMVWRPKSSLAR